MASVNTPSCGMAGVAEKKPWPRFLTALYLDVENAVCVVQFMRTDCAMTSFSEDIFENLWRWTIMCQNYNTRDVGAFLWCV